MVAHTVIRLAPGLANEFPASAIAKLRGVLGWRRHGPGAWATSQGYARAERPVECRLHRAAAPMPLGLITDTAEKTSVPSPSGRDF